MQDKERDQGGERERERGKKEKNEKERIINLIDDCMAAGRGGNYQHYSNR